MKEDKKTSPKFADLSFKLKSCTPGALKRAGFDYSLKSNSENTYYYKRFPVYSFNKKDILFGIISVNYETRSVEISVLDREDNIYPQWYNREGFGSAAYKNMVDNIDKNILKEIKHSMVIKVTER